MDEPELPASPEALANLLSHWRVTRRGRQASNRGTHSRRQLNAAERTTVLKKIAEKCHICGGRIVDRWHADHVLAHSAGGLHAADNYLPAHALCNSYRWDYEAEEFQWILKIGVWARTQMERRSILGAAMLKAFFAYEVRRMQRRRVTSD